MRKETCLFLVTAIFNSAAVATPRSNLAAPHSENFQQASLLDSEVDVVYTARITVSVMPPFFYKR